MRPALHLFVDGAPVGRLVAPTVIAPRDWILGVAALHLLVVEGRPIAQLRAHATGAGAAKLWPLAPCAVVQVALSVDGAPPTLPTIAPPTLRGSAARLTLALDGAQLDEISLPVAELSREPSPRAFGHVFCRWLRDGASETGFDLTDFLALPPGAKYQRRVARALVAGQVVSYGVAL